MRVRTLGRAVAASAVFAAVALTPTVASGSVLPIPDVDIAIGTDARESTDYRAVPDSATPAPAPEPRIVGGEPTTTDRFPWMVALVTSADSPYCGGALIAPDRVLTAAHCVSGKSTSSLRVVAGRTDMRTDDGVTTRVRQVWTHPGYRSPLGGDDVAVLTLDRAPGYRTIPLETDPGAYPPGRMSTVLGWGYTAEQGPVSPVLRAVDVPLVADRDCDATYPDFDARTMVCAGERGGGRDACSGDSGGPLIADGRLIGVVSWGSGCARPNLPGVYVRITAYTAAVGEQLR